MEYIGTFENPIKYKHVYQCELDKKWEEKIGMNDGIYKCILPFGRSKIDNRIYFIFECTVCGSFTVRLGQFRDIPRDCRCYQVGRFDRDKLTHSTWHSMRVRCLNKNVKDYKNYGGRGISIQKEWSIYQNFVMDMGLRPSENHVIDRIDVNGNYEKENCRWVDCKTSSRNTRRSRKELYKGELMHIFTIAELEKINKQLIADRWSMGIRGKRLWKKGRLNAS